MRRGSGSPIDRNTHDLKILPVYYEAARRGDKMFEIRLNDRNYRVGDDLTLREWTPEAGFTHRALRRRIIYIATGGDHGLAADHVVLGLKKLPPIGNY